MTVPEHLANRDLDVEAVLPASALPERARVVIVGGGIVGASIAWHLTAAGERDVVLIERGRLTNGTTWHAAGLVSQVRGSHALTALARINAETYERVERETGVATGIRRNGALTIARTEARMTEIRYGISMARDAGVDVELVDRARIGELWPAAVTEDLVGGVLFPTDGTVNPGSAALAFARGAVDRGARYVPGTAVTGLRRERGRAPGDRAGRRRPGRPGEHRGGGRRAGRRPVDVRAGPAGRRQRRALSGRARVGHDRADARPPRPACRSCATSTATCTSAATAIGWSSAPSSPTASRCCRRACRPTASSSSGRTGTTSRRSSAQARHRVPALADVGFAHYLRAPESFTPDSNFQLGFVPEVGGLFVAAGLNSQGIIFGPGVGKAAAEWIIEGHPTMDLVEVDVARTGGWANQRRWLAERTVESLGGLYAMHWPGKQPYTARGLRRLPLDAAHRAAGAAMGQVGGWERPLWFEPGLAGGGREPEIGYDYASPSWFPAVREEVRATREGVALYDLTTYAKFLVAGPGALAGLQRLVTSDLDVAVGRIVYTVMANERGGIELDPTITRLADDRFLVLAPTLTQRRCEGLLRNGLPPDAVVTDVTSGWATLHIAGPRSRELLARLTDEDISAAAWPFLAAREIEVGRSRAWAFRVSFTGELGWELAVPTEFVADLYEHVVAAGADLGLRHAGSFAFDAARLERGFRSWGHDIGPLDDPFASGLGFTVSRRKAADYVGREALEALRASAAADDAGRRLVSVHAPDAVLWHGESMLRDGERAGFVTSAGIAPTLGGSVGLAWVRGPIDGATWQVEIGGDPVPCRVSLDPFYDPTGERLRS